MATLATLTRVNIRDRALEALGVKAAGVDARPGDGARALEAVNARMDELSGRGLAPFDFDLIPAYAQTPIIHLCARDLAMSFGVSAERYQGLLLEEKAALTSLRTQAASDEIYLRTRAEYF